MSDDELIQAQRKLNKANERLRRAKEERLFLLEQHRALNQLSEYLLSLSPEELKAWIDKHSQLLADEDREV